MNEVSIWQLADDPATYGPCAGHFILTTPDGESEITAFVFTKADVARGYAWGRGWKVVPLQLT